MATRTGVQQAVKETIKLAKLINKYNLTVNPTFSGSQQALLTSIVSQAPGLFSILKEDVS